MGQLMDESSSFCITTGRGFFGRQPKFLVNGSPGELQAKTKGTGLTVFDADGLLCSCDGGPAVMTRHGKLSVSYTKDPGVQRNLEIGSKKWLWRQKAEANDIGLSRYFPELNRWGGIKDRIFHRIENLEFQ
jgi:hypothetical protein